MAKSTSKVGRLGLILLGLASVLPSAMALENNQKYCSKMNTATGDGTPSIYQSNGLCQKQCVGTHAFAVLTDNLCWCSDYIPGTTEDREDCDFPCKGYDQEACGGSDLYGYIRLNLPPKGTKGAPSSTSKKPEAPTTVTAPGTTITELVTPTPSSSPTFSSASSSDSSTTSTSSKTSASSSTTTSDSSSSETSEALATVTESGEERIVTVIPTPADPIETGKKSADKDSGGSGSKLSTGAAVGLTIGLVALASIVAIIIFFFMRKRKRDRDAEALRSGSPAVLNSGPPSRTMSEHSRYMLGTDGRHVVGNFQDDMNQPGNRRSRLMPVDPRLDPYAVGGVYSRGDGTHSRESVMSIRDDRDYSRKVTGGVVPGAAQSPPRRVLGVANPDSD